MARKATPAAKRGSRDGSKAREAFKAVNEITADGTTTRQQAFAIYAEQIGSRAGTVAANFYRQARSEGAVKPRRARRSRTATRSRTAAPARGGRRRTPASAPEMDAILLSLVGSVAELVEAVKSQQEETRQLRERLDGVRTLLA